MGDRTQDFFALTIETTHAGAELLTAALDSVGASMTEIVEERRDVERFLSNEAKHWDFVEEAVLAALDDKTRVRVYVPDAPEGRALRARIDEKLAWLKSQDFGFDIGSLALCEGFVPYEDWAGSYKKYFKPTDVGARLTICPEWERENYDPSGRVVLYIDPGMVFGSGTHETTSLCLEMISETVRGGERVFDAGCGSGILSIAALLFGAKFVLGCDIDPAAAHVVMGNARNNGIGPDRLRVEIGDVIEDAELIGRVGTGYDLVTSNIIASIVAALAPTAARLLVPGGRWIASGVIRERLPEVEAAMRAAGFSILETRIRGEWVALEAVK